MTANHFIPSNKDDFYSPPDKEKLFQGDIIDAYSIDFKALDDPIEFPDYYIIITKSCDMNFGNTQSSEKKFKGMANLLPLIPLRQVSRLIVGGNRGGIVFLPVIKLLTAFAGLNIDKVDALIKGQNSRFMYLPPDGVILREPMVIDFDLPEKINGDDTSNVNKIILGKKLQIASPLREKFGQRYANHFSAIGLNDDSIRSKDYVNRVKELLKNSNVKN